MPTINTPIPNLTDSQKTFQAIMENQIIINTAMTELQGKTDKLYKTVFLGNGEIPLVEQVRDHKDFIDNLKYWAKFLIGALIIQTIAFGASVVVAVVRFLPILERIANHP